ncbi:MAG: hypothetical protein ACI80I_001274, partial [Akkermansiaceae bacterium]
DLATDREPLCGLCCLLQTQLLLTQHLFAIAAMVVWLCSLFHRSGRSNGSTAPDLKLTFRCTVHELTCRGTKQTFAAIADAENLRICSVAHSAQQRISPDRSFDRVRTHAIRTTYSLNAVSTFEMWRKRKCAMIAQLIGLRCPDSSTFVFVRNIR